MNRVGGERKIPNFKFSRSNEPRDMEEESFLRSGEKNEDRGGGGGDVEIFLMKGNFSALMAS